MSPFFRKLLITLAVILAFFLFANPLYIINEGEQVVVTRFGQIVNSSNRPGLHIRAPLIDNVITYPRKLMSLDGDSQRIPTKENQFIIVDTTSRWRISDPVKFYESVTNIDSAYSRLSDIVDSAVRTVITSSGLNEVVRDSNLINELQHQENFALGADAEDVQLSQITGEKVTYETISRGRRALSAEMAQTARTKVPEFGIELIDIVLRQIKYSDELTESVYNRMIKDRNQIAQTFRSTGEGKKAEWMGKLENERKTLLSSAYNNAERLKGEADAEASRIYADSYSKDPEF
ncbi:MAG TPA: protease modulator HflC, partial [Treponemataceae bacterium]|nr:protease modulator HflC [Treponemataceae bacterium]